MAKSAKPAPKAAPKPIVKAATPRPAVSAKPKAPTRAKSKAKPSTADLIEKANEIILSKLRALNIAHGLQSEIEWCLASYRSDGNPIGLYQMARRALGVFQELSAIDASAVESALIAEIDAAIKAGE